MNLYAHCKYLFDNRYGTDQSVWDGIMRTTNLLVSGKTAVVASFGWCGRGIALRARGLGARVIITEVDPVRALEAVLEGYQVMPMAAAAPLGEIFIMATGCRRVITAEHYPLIKDGAILANAGHFDVELDLKALSRLAVRSGAPRHNIAEYIFPDGKKLYLLAEGRLVNLAAGDGHPAEIMDLFFALQFLALHLLRQQEQPFPKQVLPLPREIDCRVASLKLRSLGVDIDTLSPDQRDYLQSWTMD